jgi:putative SOS response-associated peptidase YedK
LHLPRGIDAAFPLGEIALAGNEVSGMSQFGDETGRAVRTQLVFRRHPETGLAVEGRLRWGLIPHYADARPDLQPIHARAETISEKKMFRDAYRRRRCIVPMTSFFQKDPKGKRYAISRRDGELFGVAGIWENWRDPETSQWERAFAFRQTNSSPESTTACLRYCRTNSSRGGFRTRNIRATCWCRFQAKTL